MSDRKAGLGLQDDIVAFDNYMEVVADTSVLELTTDVNHVQPTSLTVTTLLPVDGDGVGPARSGTSSPCASPGGRYAATWGCVYRLMSSSVGLVVLLVIYTLIGAAVLHHTEYDSELRRHARLDAVRRRVTADIINVTTAHHRSRDRRQVESRDRDDVALAAAVEALLVRYGDARQALNPSAKSPSWTFTGAVYFCGTVYTTIGQC